jgi:hypothetical protein
MQIRLIGKLCLALTACLALNAFSTTARAGYPCYIYRVNIILQNGSTIYGFFWIMEDPGTTGTEIHDFIKRDRWWTVLTIYRRLQTIRYPKEQVFAAAREDMVEVRTSNIRSIEYLSRMDCQSENQPDEILELPQRAINFLQKVPFALVETPTSDLSYEVCLSYNKQIGKPELRRVCGKNRQIEINPKLTDSEQQSVYFLFLKRRFDSLFNRGIIVIHVQGIT